jgi:hypothetical protein
MAEKRVFEDYLVSGIAQVRQQHGYPTLFRRAAGAFHAFNMVAYGSGAATLIFTKDAVVAAAQRSGAGIQASSSLGMGVLVLGAVALAIALLNAWAAWSLFTARQQAYWYLLLVNALSCVWLAFLTTPANLLQWMQLVLSGLIALLLVFDPRVKAFYYKGPLAKAWWEEELRRRAAQTGAEALKTPTNRTAIGATILMIVALVFLYSAVRQPAAAPQPVAATRNPRTAPQASATPPLSIDPAMLYAIQSMPEDLTAAITANTQGRTEIVAVQHTSRVPLEPMATPIEDVWCITIYPAATMTLYVEQYVAPQDDLFITAGEYVPGASSSGRIDHFLAARRGEAWELYHPEVYSWDRLGC